MRLSRRAARSPRSRTALRFACLALLLSPALLRAQAPNVSPSQPATPQQMPGTKNTGAPGSTQGDTKSSAPSKAQDSASGAPELSSIAPATPPPRVFVRPRIGLALGGGGALGLSEVGVLAWFEDHRIPVDEIAGTSMGCMISALYSTGRTPDQLRTVMNDRVFSSVFTFSNSYQSRSFRRREDSRELPNAITIGLKHGVSFRNSVLTDQGLNAFLDRQFVRYDDRTDFNTLPIPLRCLSTDLNTGQPATFARGSIPDAVRASVSLPGVFQPFEMNGHAYVDGGVLENLPTASVRAMQPDVVLAVSLPLIATTPSDLSSLLGVLGRSFSVAIEGAEREQRKLADVVLIPDLTGFSATDYLKTPALAERGYAAAEAHRAELLRYALSEADWQAYLAHRESLRRGPPAPVLRVRVEAPSDSATLATQRLFAPLVNQPVDTAKIEALLDVVRADGRYDADYTIGYETARQFAAQSAGKAQVPPGTVDTPIATQPTPQAAGEKQRNSPNSAIPAVENVGNDPAHTGGQLEAHPEAHGPNATLPATAASLADIPRRPIVLVTVTDKKTGPPFLLLGINIAAQTTAVTRATLEATLLDQDLGGYGSELRTRLKVGYLTQIAPEYFHPFNSISTERRTFFVAPRAELLRQPFSIYRDQVRLSDRRLQRYGVGADIGLTNNRVQETRAGFDFFHIDWTRTVGEDQLPDFHGTAQRARLRYAFDTQDRALVPQFGLHLVAESAYLFHAVGSDNTPQLSSQLSYARTIPLWRFLTRQPLPKGLSETDPNRPHEIFMMSAEGGTMFGHNVAEPFRYTLGGPLRLTASAIDEYRGTEYYLLEPAILRRIAQLPSPLGQSIYLGAAYEFGHIHGPGAPSLYRQDAYFGLVAETPLGVVTLAPAFGTNGERKFVFTLGKLF